MRLNLNNFQFQTLTRIRKHRSWNKKRMIANKHSIKCYTCSININFATITFTSNLFRSHIQNSTDFFVMRFTIICICLCSQPKVYYFKFFLENTLRRKLNIFWFNISVKIVNIMNFFKSF